MFKEAIGTKDGPGEGTEGHAWFKTVPGVQPHRQDGHVVGTKATLCFQIPYSGESFMWFTAESLQDLHSKELETCIVSPRKRKHPKT